MKAILVLALLAAFVAPTGTSPAVSAPETTLSDVVADFLAEPGAAARMDVIVTFHDRSGLERLRGIAPDAATTRTLPMALANLWDSAAPVAVARAAGLHVSRTDGTPLRYNRPDPWLPDLVVCRPELTDRVLELLK